jgi:DHA1 family tetracycline resistance protein-like MFS transporter
MTKVLHSDISTAAIYGGWLSLTYALMQFVFAPILGNLSDRFGRRPFLLISALGFSIDCLFLVFAPNIFWLFIGRTIAGITGASFSVASAWIADISTDDNRTKNFGYINAAYSSGFIIGPAIGGILGQFGTHIPFIAAAILSFSNFVFGFFLFPESLDIGNRRAFNWKQANPFGALKYLNKFPMILTLISAMFLVTVAGHSMPSVWAYFTTEKFNWSSDLIGYSLTFLGVMSIIVQSWFVGIFSKRMGDKSMIIIGIILSTIGLLLIAFSNSNWVLILALILYVLGNVHRAGFQSMISSSVPKNEQGELQGSLSSLMSLATIISPPLMTMSFSYFTSSSTSKLYFPGIPYLIAAFLTLLSVIPLLKVKKISKIER